MDGDFPTRLDIDVGETAVVRDADFDDLFFFISV
jgi:hypothetical protein